MKCFRPGRAEAEDTVARRHDATGDVTRMDYPVVKKNVISLGCCLAAIHKFLGLDLHFGFACCRLI